MDEKTTLLQNEQAILSILFERNQELIRTRMECERERKHIEDLQRRIDLMEMRCCPPDRPGSSEHDKLQRAYERAVQDQQPDPTAE